MKEQALALGCEVPGSLSQATDYLVCGENVGASKITRATDLAVKVISESEWVTLMNESKV
jgi:DNA ligase (NAD+)